MNEMEKCLAGQNYNCHDGIFLELKRKSRELLSKYNQFSYEQKTEKYAVLQELFGGIGTNVSVGSPFLCDYGKNIYMGNNVSVNMNCTFVDCNMIEIGSNVLISSNVQMYTAAHPVELSERVIEDWQPDSGLYFCQTYALPIKIGNGCWIGGGVIPHTADTIIRIYPKFR